MVCLSQEYNPNVYNSLREVVQVSRLVTPEDVYGVGKIIIK